MSNLQSKLQKNFKKKKNNFSYRRIDLRDADKFINKDYTKEKQKKFRDFNKWIELMDGEYIINNENNDIIGRVFIDKNNKGINSLRVMDKYKGYGFGEILINDAIYNYHGEWLGVHIDNEVAIRLYKKVGFIEMKNSDPDAMYGEIMFMKLPKNIIDKAKNKSITEKVIIEKYLEGKLSENKYNELMCYYSENVLFNEPNFVINMNKWGPGHPLWITGTSGDGKSTLAKKLYTEEKNTALVTLDWLLVRLCYPREKYFRKVVNDPVTQKQDFIIIRFINEHPEMPWELGIDIATDKNPNRDIATFWFNKFFQWLLEESKTSYYKYKIIVEGCAIAAYGNPRIFVNEPLIIMGTSQLQSKFNRIHRDHTDSNKDLLTSIKNELKRDYINDLEKQKRDFKKMIKTLIR